MELENIILSDVMQSKKDKYHVWFHMWIPDPTFLFQFLNTYFKFYLFICVSLCGYVQVSKVPTGAQWQFQIS